MTNKTLEAVRGVLGLVAGDYLFTLHEGNQEHIDNGNPEECVDLNSIHNGLIEIAKAFNLDIKEFDVDGLINVQEAEPVDEREQYIDGCADFITKEFKEKARWICDHNSDSTEVMECMTDIIADEIKQFKESYQPCKYSGDHCSVARSPISYCLSCCDLKPQEEQDASDKARNLHNLRKQMHTELDKLFGAMTDRGDIKGIVDVMIVDTVVGEEDNTIQYEYGSEFIELVDGSFVLEERALRTKGWLGNVVQPAEWESLEQKGDTEKYEEALQDCKVK